MTEDQIKHMVDRFLAWRLPEPWCPDNGVSYQRPNYAHAPADHDWPTGTNLFDYSQATEMVRNMIDGMPSGSEVGVADAQIIGVVVVLISPRGDAVATVSDFDRGGYGGFSLYQSQMIRAERALAYEMLRAFCNPIIAQVTQEYRAKEIMQEMCRNHGYKVTVIPVGHKDKKETQR